MLNPDGQGNVQNKPVYYQLRQYVCQYDAERFAVSCQPFIRTFLESGRNLVEVTTTVNRGGRLPVAEDLRKEASTEPLVVPIEGVRPPRSS
ncbi:hypothetical protein JCM6882_003655 [Rhodosporidiobolus microsporus]